MTVSSDIQLALNDRRPRLFIKIDGVEPIFWQDDGTGLSPQSSGGEHPLDSDCIGMFRLNEESDTNAIDSSNYELELSWAAGGGGWVVAGAGMFGNARYCSNSSGGFKPYAITEAQGAHLRANSGFTVACWIDYDGPVPHDGANKTIFSVIHGGGFGLIMTNDGRPSFFYDPISYPRRYVNSSSSLSVGWHHLALTWDGSTMSLFVDAELAAIEGVYGAVDLFGGSNYYTPSLIGNVDNYNYSCPWLIDDVGYYSSVKSLSWIERYSAGEETGWSRSGKVCLLPPAEHSMSLDLGEMKSDLSQMTFNLIDIKDSDGTSYFGKLFSTGKWDTCDSWLLKDSAIEGGEILAPDDDEITIAAGSVPTFPDDKVLYIGNETFQFDSANYNGDGSTTLSGCTRGLYPCVGDNYAIARYIPYSGDSNYTREYIAQAPFTCHGKRVALYVITYDLDNNKWLDEENAELLWVGRINDTIKYDGSKAQWTLSCKSILHDLDMQMFYFQAQTTLAQVLNLCGGYNTFTIKEMVRDYTNDVAFPIAIGTIEIETKAYNNAESLQLAICNAVLNISNWQFTEIGVGESSYSSILVNKGSNVLGQDGYGWDIYDVSSVNGFLMLSNLDGKYYFRFSYYQPDPDYTYKGMRYIELSFDGNDYGPCHALIAMGFEPHSKIILDPSENTGTIELQHTAENLPFISYQPLHPATSGQRIYVTDNRKLASDQGDDSDDEHAWILASGATINGKEDQSFHAKYISKNIDEDYFNSYGSVAYYLGLTSINSDIGILQGNATKYDYVGSRKGEELKEIKQSYIPKSISKIGQVHKGPFRILLELLSSSGSQNSYNGTYDVLPYGYGCGIQSTLIDSESFINADLNLNWEIANRGTYAVTEPISFIELIQREAKLFGKTLVWSGGELKIVDVMAIDLSYTQTISDGDISSSSYKPTINMGVNTIINQYRCKTRYNPSSGKWGPEVVISLMDSINGMQLTKAVEIEHPGLIATAGANIENLLGASLRNRQIRYPLPVVSIPLKPQKMTLVNVGDTSLFQSSYFPDPFGSGTMSTNCRALVINISRNYSNFTGKVTLLLLSRYYAIGNYWSPAAVVNKSATNGGWDDGSNTLTLEAHHYGYESDYEDGASFNVGDVIIIQERAPATLSSPQHWHAVVASAYNSTLHTLELEPVTLTGWDTGKEYFITYDEYTNAATAQKLTGTWAADNDSNQFSDGTQAMRWG